jgi:hypothetical protein
MQKQIDLKFSVTFSHLENFVSRLEQSVLQASGCRVQK